MSGVEETMPRIMTATLTAALVAAALPLHAEDGGQGIEPDAVAQAAVQECQRRQEIEALQAIAHELRTLNGRMLDLTREMRDLRRELERKR